MSSYQQIENVLGCKLPSRITFFDPNGPPYVHSALLINDRTGEIIAYSVNKCISSTLNDLSVRTTVHAEQELLYAIDKQMKEKRVPKSRRRGQKTLVSLRFNRNGKISQSKVCTSCANMISNKYKGYINNIIYCDENNVLCNVSIDQMCNISKLSSRQLAAKQAKL